MAKSFHEKVDDYKDTVFAVIGFANLFKYDDQTKNFNENVKVAQGRKMKTSRLNKLLQNNEITPDLIIQINEEEGIVAEVKISFPKNQDYWQDDFNQLIRYDDDLENWWTETYKIKKHDIVLLLHMTRSAAIIKYYSQKNNEGHLKFERPFSVVEFHKFHQAKEFYFFRKAYNHISASQELNEKLGNGISVPSEKLMIHYEKHKIYDSRPPMPYLLHILWENVILRFAFENGTTSSRKKIPIDTDINSIHKELYENCSFKGFNFNEDEHQPRMPLKAWVKDAVNTLIKFKYAEWINQNEGTCRIYFKRIKDVFQNFIDLCMEHNIDIEGLEGVEYQEELFPKEG